MQEIFISSKYFLLLQKYFSFTPGILKTEIGAIDRKPVCHLIYDEEKLTIKDILILMSKVLPVKENATIYYHDFKEKTKIANYILNIKEELNLKPKINLELLSDFTKAKDIPIKSTSLKRNLISEFKNYQSKKSINEDITKHKNMEPPFLNKYWDEENEGVYVDIETKTPLFTSKDKIQVGYGWPTFKKVINKDDIYTTINYSYGIPRCEVISKHSGNFLGHHTNNIYIINSASLEFIPNSKL